jgi:hypothetical protein
MGHESFLRDWLDAAGTAGFLPFEAVHPSPTSSSLSGLGGGSNGGLHCEIAHVINGEEIFIDTRVEDDPAIDDDWWTRREILGVVQSLLEGDVTLPFTLHLTLEEQTVDVLVDGVAVTFRGIAGDELEEWRLRANVDHRTVVVIQGRKGSSAPTAIGRRQDLNIGELATDS